MVTPVQKHLSQDSGTFCLFCLCWGTEDQPVDRFQVRAGGSPGGVWILQLHFTTDGSSSEWTSKKHQGAQLVLLRRCFFLATSMSHMSVSLRNEGHRNNEAQMFERTSQRSSDRLFLSCSSGCDSPVHQAHLMPHHVLQHLCASAAPQLLSF